MIAGERPITEYGEPQEMEVGGETTVISKYRKLTRGILLTSSSVERRTRASKSSRDRNPDTNS